MSNRARRGRRRLGDDRRPVKIERCLICREPVRSDALLVLEVWCADCGAAERLEVCVSCFVAGPGSGSDGWSFLGDREP